MLGWFYGIGQICDRLRAHTSILILATLSSILYSESFAKLLILSQRVVDRKLIPYFFLYYENKLQNQNYVKFN